MGNILFAVAGLHLAAFAGVLLLSKYSTVLVDEDYRPMDGDDAGKGWQERVVRPHDATMTATPRG